MRRCLTLLAAIVAVAAIALTLLVPGGSSALASPPPREAAPVAATKQVFLRPVTTEGRPAPGWRVKRERGTTQCDGRSPSAVNPGIASCYPTALGLRACWKSQRHTVLCVRDARVRELVRIRYTGAFPRIATGPRTPSPIDLELTTGNDCLIRNGGAWGSPPQHPQWVGFYSCGHGSVYGPGASRDGIDRSAKQWSVRVWHTTDGDRGSIARRQVARVWYVGTAAVS